MIHIHPMHTYTYTHACASDRTLSASEAPPPPPPLLPPPRSPARPPAPAPPASRTSHTREHHISIKTITRQSPGASSRPPPPPAPPAPLHTPRKNTTRPPGTSLATCSGGAAALPRAAPRGRRELAQLAEGLGRVVDGGVGCYAARRCAPPRRR